MAKSEAATLLYQLLFLLALLLKQDAVLPSLLDVLSFKRLKTKVTIEMEYTKSHFAHEVEG